jgi:hypothetical protein
MAKIGNFLSPKGKKNSIMMGDSTADLEDPSLQPINAMSSNDSKSAEPSMTRKSSISQLQQQSTATSSPVASAPASPSLGPQTPPRRSSLSQNGPGGATVMLLTPPTEFGTSSSNVSPITVTLAPVNTSTPPQPVAVSGAAAASSSASINLLSPPNAGGSVRGGHHYTPSTSGLSFTSLPPGYRPQGDDGWGLSLYTPRGPGHLSVPSTGSAPGHHSTPSAAWGNSIVSHIH